MERTSSMANRSTDAGRGSPFVTAYASSFDADAALPDIPAAALGKLGRTSSPASPTASPERVAREAAGAVGGVDGSTLERGISNISTDSFSFDDDTIGDLTHTTSLMCLESSAPAGAYQGLGATSSEEASPAPATAAAQPDMMNLSAEPFAMDDAMDSTHSDLSSVDSSERALNITSSAWQELGAASAGSDDLIGDDLNHDSIMDQLAVSPRRQREVKLYWQTFEALAEHAEHVEAIVRSATTQPTASGFDEATRRTLHQFFALCRDMSHTPGVYHLEESDWAFMKQAKAAVTSTLGAKEVQAVTEAAPEPEPARAPEKRAARTPRGSPPGERRAMYVPAAGPIIPDGLRRSQPASGTPQSPGYNRRTLTWNEVGPDGLDVRNAQGCYSYSGTSCCSAIDGSARAALRCQDCSQFFFQDEVGADLLTPGFLPHQRNYTFKCGWCCSDTSGDFHEEFQLTKPKLFDAIVDVFLNLMAVHKRQDYKVAELQQYLFAHWNTLMFGWPPLEAERDPNGAGKKYRSIAPEINKKSTIAKKPSLPYQFQVGEKNTYKRLFEQGPRQPMEMLKPGETWDNTCEKALFASPRPAPVRPAPVGGGAAAMSFLPATVSDQAKHSSVRRPRGDSIDLVGTNSRSDVDPSRGSKTRARTPRSVPVVVDAIMHPAEPEQLADSDVGMRIIAALSEQLRALGAGQQCYLDVVAAHNADAFTAGVGTPARVTNLLRRCCEAMTSASDVFFAAVTVLGPQACQGRGLLERAAVLSREDWVTAAFEDLQESWVEEAFASDDQKRVTIAKFVEGLGEAGAVTALCDAVDMHCMSTLV